MNVFLLMTSALWACKHSISAASQIGELPYPDLAPGHFPATVTKRKGPRLGGCSRWVAHLSSGLLTCHVGTLFLIETLLPKQSVHKLMVMPQACCSLWSSKVTVHALLPFFFPVPLFCGIFPDASSGTRAAKEKRRIPLLRQSAQSWAAKASTVSRRALYLMVLGVVPEESDSSF